MSTLAAPVLDAPTDRDFLLSLRDAALRTLAELMSPTHPPSERRQAATAALRYLSMLEKPPGAGRSPSPPAPPASPPQAPPTARTHTAPLPQRAPAPMPPPGHAATTPTRPAPSVAAGRPHPAARLALPRAPITLAGIAEFARLINNPAPHPPRPAESTDRSNSRAPPQSVPCIPLRP